MLSQLNQKKGFRLLVALIVAFGLLAGAADGAEKKKKRNKKNFILSEQTAKKMMKVGKYMQDEDFESALGVLETLTRRRRMKAHDKAVVFQMRGFALAALERYPEAAASFETSVEQNALPEGTMHSLKFNLAQLQMANGNFARAIELLEEWFEEEEKPGAQAHFAIAASYMQTEAFDKALPHTRLMVKKSKKPVERNLAMLLACEFQNGNLIETLEVLKQLTTLFPRKSYYMQLAYGYANMGEEENALAMMELVRAQGWLDKNAEFVGLAQRYLMHELPYMASDVMQTGFSEGVVEETSKNYELYASALLNAREYDKALPPLTKAAELAEDGELYVRLAQVYLEVENWKQARESLEKALSRGDLRDPGTAHLLVGISNFNEKRFKSARSAFRLAAEEEKTADSATKWLEHVERELGFIESGG
jgi:tetratricopeptide (TPR) repeat protein